MCYIVQSVEHNVTLLWKVSRVCHFAGFGYWSSSIHFDARTLRSLARRTVDKLFCKFFILYLRDARIVTWMITWMVTWIVTDCWSLSYSNSSLTIVRVESHKSHSQRVTKESESVWFSRHPNRNDRIVQIQRRFIHLNSSLISRLLTHLLHLVTPQSSL